MKNTGKQPFLYTDIPLAARIDSEDTELAMQLAQCPKFDSLQPLGSLVAGMANRKPGLLTNLLWPLKYARCYFVLRHHAKKMELAARLSEYQWQILLSDYRARKFVFANDDESSRNIREEARKSHLIFQDILSNLARIERFFPKLIPKIRISIERTQKIQCEYIPSLCSEVDAEKIIEAKQHYEQGTLMDFETFANAIHGH